MSHFVDLGISLFLFGFRGRFHFSDVKQAGSPRLISHIRTYIVPIFTGHKTNASVFGSEYVERSTSKTWRR